jgi:hypothetical protein
MIATSSAFATANAALAKKPLYIIEIEGYSRAFSMADGLGSFSGIPPTGIVLQSANRANIGGIGAPGDVHLPNATPAGNILLAFMNNGDGGTSPGISDTAGNTWVPICSNVSTLAGFPTSIWRAVAVASGPGNVVTFTTGAGRTSSDFFVIEIPAAYSASFFAHTSGAAFTTYAGAPTATTSDGNTLTVPLNGNGAAQDLFEISVASGSGVIAAVAIGFLVTSTGAGPGLSDGAQLISQAGGTQIVGGSTATGFDWLKSIEDLKITVSDLDGGADLADLVFTVQDRGQQLTADLASFTFEGKNVRLLAGFQGMAIKDYVTFFPGQIDTVESANANTEYTFTASNINVKKLTQKIYTTGDDGFGIDSNHPHTIVGEHPLDILVDALEQAGVSSIQIDTAKIAFYRDGIFNSYKFSFTLNSAVTAKDFIENELMKPLGMYLWVNNLGVISINSFYPAVSGNGTYTPPTPPVMTITTDQIMGMVVETQADLVNQVIFDFDDDGSGGSKFLAEEIVDYDVSIAKYGLVGGHTIQSQGMRSASQGYFMAALIGRLICLRYGLKTLVLDPLTLFWSACTLEPGDIIAVTHPFLPDRVAGTVGITTKFFEVMDRNWKFFPGQVELKLLAIDLSKFKQYQITPNAEAAYAAASTLDKGKYMFQCDSATGEYSTSAPANTLG